MSRRTTSATAVRRRSKRTSYDAAASEYYALIKQDPTSRAKMFLEHTPLDKIKVAIYNEFSYQALLPLAWDDNLHEIDKQYLDYLRENAPDTYNFIRSLEEGNAAMADYNAIDPK